MKKTETFEEFVRNYLKNTALSNSKESFASWVRKNGKDAEAEYRDKTLGEVSNYIRSRSEYGKTAEALGNFGLRDSGYADYINKKASADLTSALQKAKTEKIETSEKNVSDYIQNAKELEETNAKMQRSVIKEIERKREINYDRAYEYALDAGLDEKSAETTAKKAIGVARVRLKNDILELIVSERMSKSQTEEYAKGLGLDEEEIKELGEIAKNINETVNSSFYAEYIKDLIEKQNNSSK